MTVKVLGACCARSLKTFENVKAAAARLGLGVEVENVGDLAEIASYGVLGTPALVVDDAVLSSGKLIELDEAMRLLGKAAGRTVFTKL